MNNFWRTLIAGYAGWKWGGGCLGFVVVFIVVFYLLGYIHCWKFSSTLPACPKGVIRKIIIKRYPFVL